MTVCESIPADRDHPHRLGNELLCRRCQQGDCEHCASRHSTAVFCEHPCAWVPDAPFHFPRPRKET